MIESSRLPFRKHVCHTVPLIPTICFSSEGGLAMMAPKARKLLSADALFGMLRTGFADIADHRPGDTDISLTDALMSAFALFSLKSPSLLAFDKERTEGNLHRVYGIERVPCDTAMREMLDPVEPASLRPLFTDIFRALQRGKALEEMVFVEGHYLLALDGTGYFSSQQIHCASCLEMHHRNGTVTYHHQMLSAALVHPDKREVIPLMPEPIIKQDGADKNDCERNAAKRLIAKLRQDHPHLKVIVTEDSLSSNAPHIEVLQDHHLHYIWSCTATLRIIPSPPKLGKMPPSQDMLEGATPWCRITLSLI